MFNWNQFQFQKWSLLNNFNKHWYSISNVTPERNFWILNQDLPGASDVLVRVGSLILRVQYWQCSVAQPCEQQRLWQSTVGRRHIFICSLTYSASLGYYSTWNSTKCILISNLFITKISKSWYRRQKRNHPWN